LALGNLKPMFLLAICSFLAMFSVASSGSDKWELEYTGNETQIYTRQDASGMKEFKAITLAQTTVKNCVGIMDDINRHHDFMYRIGNARRVNRLSNHITHTYYQIDMPWPLDDRDIVSKVEFSVEEDGTAVYAMTATPDEVDLQDGHVRIEKAEGQWRFKPTGTNQVEITYQYKSDPVGLPTWVVNMFLLSAPKETLNSMRELLPNVDYSEKTYPWYD